MRRACRPLSSPARLPMKRLNTRLILIVAGGLLALAVAVFLIHGWQVSRHARGLLRRAELAEAEGDVGKTIRTLGQYLRYRPEDVQTFTHLALLMEQSTHDRQVDRDEFFAVQRTLEKAIRQQPDDDELRRSAVDFYLRFGRASDSVDHVRHMIRQPGGDADAELQMMLARCLVGAADITQAIAVLSPVVGYDSQTAQFDPDAALDAGNIEAYVLLAALLRSSRSNASAADVVIHQAVETNPQSWQAHLARGQYLRRHYPRAADQRDSAAADIRKASQLAPDEPQVALAMAQLEMENNRLDEAERILDRGIQQHPSNEEFYRLRVMLALRRGDQDAARTFVKQGLQQAPTSGRLLISQAEFALDDGDYDRALAIAEQLPPGEPFRFYREMFQAQVLLRKSDWRPAAALLDELLPQLMPTDRLREISPALASDRKRLATQGYLWLADCYENLRQWDLQRDASLQAQRLAPNSLTAKFSEVKALAAMSKFEQAERELTALRAMATRQGVELPNLRVWETKFLAAQQRRKPAGQRDWKEIESRFLQQLALLNLDEPARAAAHVRLLLEQQRLDDAAARLTPAISEFPQNADLLKLSVHITQVRHGPQAALAELEDVGKALGDTVDIRVHKAVLLANLQTGDAKKKLLALEENVDKFSAADVDRLRRSLAAMHGRVGNRDAAQRLLRQIADANPGDVEIRDNLFELARAAGDQPQMKAASDEIKSVAGADSPAWQFVEAKRLVWEIQNDKAPPEALDAARELARDARSQRPNWYVLSLLDGELDVLAGNNDAAIEHFQAAIEQGPPMPQVVRRLVELLARQQRFDEAREAMEKLAAAGGASLLDERARSRAQAGAGNLQDAIALAERAAEDSDNPSDHVWLGNLLTSVGRGDEAITAYQRAVDLAPTHRQAALTLLRQLIISDRRAEAESLVRRMAIDMPQQDAAGLLGLCYEMLGQLPMAQHYFEMALAARPGDPAALRDLAAFFLLLKNHSRAEPLLNQLLAISPSDDDDNSHIAWARRTKAKLLAASGRYAEYLAAIDLIEANTPAGGGMLAEDALLMASLALGRRDLASLDDVIERIDGARRGRALTVAEQFALARLYERCGRWSECEEIMTPLIGAAGDNEQMIAAWCEMKLRHGDLTNVALLLRDLPADSTQVKLLRARLFAEQDDSARAIEIVRSLIPPADSESRWPAILQLARFLEEIELVDEAEKYYRGIAKSPGANPLLLAEFLSRRGKVDETLDICERSLSNQNLITIVNMGVSALAANRRALADDAPQFARVEEWLARALREYPDAMELQLRRASLLEMQGEHEPAMHIYREMLDGRRLNGSDRAVVSNNLAVVLALRGECDEAQRRVEDSLREFGPVPEVLDTRALAALCRGDEASLATAVEDLEAALITLDDAVVRFHLAQAHSASGREDEARSALEESLEKGLSVRELHVLERPRLAALIQSLGISAQSRRDLQPAAAVFR